MEYSGGSKRIFNIECPSLPVRMNTDTLDDKIDQLCEQPTRDDFLEKIELSRIGVMRLLRSMIS